MKYLFTISLIVATFIGFSQPITTELPPAPPEQIRWISLEEAFEAIQTKPKKILIDVYTDWCGWCKVMDKKTFAHPQIAKYVNQNFYAVKLDAERKDTVSLGDKIYVNPNPSGRKSTHQVAIALLQGKMSYPTIVYLDEKFNMITPVPGYKDPKAIEPIINWLATDSYKTNPNFQEYMKTFKSKL